MDIFTSILTMLGGVCLFLFGMNIMGQYLEAAAGNKLRDLLGRLTTNKVAGFLTGLGVTAIIQSSGATTVMVVGFVNSGLMNLKQAINVIIGANIGTTATAWLLSLTGIDAGGGTGPIEVILTMMKPSSFAPVLAFIGIILFLFFKGSKKKNIGMILLGFATLMIGMNLMSDTMKALCETEPAVKDAFATIFEVFSHPILGVIAGIVVTTLMQSSSASVGILQMLCSTSGLTYAAVLPIIMGQNIGSCTTALISCIGANKNAKRAGLVHLFFNVIGTVLCLAVFWIGKSIFTIPLLSENANEFGIAICHTGFNVICTALMLPISGLLGTLVMKILPDKKNTKEENAELDERLLTTPPLALAQCRKLSLTMGECAIGSLKSSMGCLTKYTEAAAEEIRAAEDETDHYEDALGSYLVKLSTLNISERDSREAAMLIRAIGDFERISDHSVNVVESAEELREKEISFSEEASHELSVLMNAVNEILDLTMVVFRDNDVTAAFTIESLEEVIDSLKDSMRANHITRLQRSNCSIEAGFVWSDILTNLERVADHASNIAGGVLDYIHGNRSTHESLRAIKAGDDFYLEKFREYSEKYSLTTN
jgi:phosphate:Na+ symporter